MKYLLTLLFISTIFFSISAQNKFELGTEYFPNYSWQLDPVVDEYQGKLSHTAGISLDYRLNEYWTVGAGAAYANFGIYSEEEGDSLRWGTQHNGEGGFDSTLISGESISYLKISHIYHSIEIPIRLKYNTTGERLRFYASGGLAPRIFMKEQNKVEKDLLDGTSETETYQNENYDYQRFQLGVFAAGGVEFGLGKLATFYTGPRIQIHRFAGKSKLSDYSFTADFMQLGLEMGVRF